MLDIASGVISSVDVLPELKADARVGASSITSHGAAAAAAPEPPIRGGGNSVIEEADSAEASLAKVGRCKLDPGLKAHRLSKSFNLMKERNSLFRLETGF